MRSCSNGLDGMGQFGVALRLLLTACKATSILQKLQECRNEELTHKTNKN